MKCGCHLLTVTRAVSYTHLDVYKRQGVFLSNDLYTTFIFFEIMSFASYPMVIHNETKEAIDGSNSYLGFAVLGSLVTVSYTHLDVYKRQVQLHLLFLRNC